ncbi:hypothetical protein [Clostridium carboxidivorans]|nr:hypothetical protein [Clostridium carboxidivorans]EFG86615.1 hypothetical protein CLCAR_3562 [Clostridium carboxidivorans P7]
MKNTTNHGSIGGLAVSIDEFLKFNRYEILKGQECITNNTAKEKAIE